MVNARHFDRGDQSSSSFSSIFFLRSLAFLLLFFRAIFQILPSGESTWLRFDGFRLKIMFFLIWVVLCPTAVRIKKMRNHFFHVGAPPRVLGRILFTWPITPDLLQIRCCPWREGYHPSSSSNLNSTTASQRLWFNFQSPIDLWYSVIVRQSLHVQFRLCDEANFRIRLPPAFHLLCLSQHAYICK